jgi:ABC-type nitrate/sulfonate/bicarbonate transport system permease component
VTALTSGSAVDRFVETRAARWILPAVTIVVLLGVVEMLARTGTISVSFSSPSAIASALVGAVGTGLFWSALGVTMSAWLIAVALAMVLGSVLGVVVGSSSVIYQFLRPVIEIMRPIPSVALIPLVVLTIGTSSSSGVFLAVFAAFWQVLVTAIDGARAVDPVARDTARSYHYSRLNRFAWVQLPSTLPYLATALRLASSTALVLVVTAELIIGIPGIGQQITLARAGGAPDRMYAYIVVTGVLGLALNFVVTRVERMVLRNYPAHLRGASA